MPAHGKTLGFGVYTNALAPEGVTFTEFAMDRRKRFLVPRYYLEGDSLVLMSYWFRADTMTRLEAKGRTLAFFAFAKGTEIATAADVWWIDREGDGVFSELQWSTQFPEVPEWARKRIRGEGGSAGGGDLQ